ncbi:zinc finger protein VAR3, chloroplastic-like isoform X2 [Impatiens glandulifera]|uniref:zinc finger protein VAR3, chloroplastic-like isoform X2 n=1 Tax=Impatiens glandulifera TaxID=253017 RepID=UPI001FB15A15|nr:zinc finger protein VAR3, chloroplastic-like isoform X2 [Impatiens glandulifera]
MKFSAITIRHSWPEWVELMRTLLKNGYLEAAGSNSSVEGGLNAQKLNMIRTACSTFARKQSHLIRYFSRKDMEVLVESGCWSTKRKVVNSGKRLRAYVGIDERNVCRSCVLRGKCDRAYVNVTEEEKEEGAHTLDIMRLLFAYGNGDISNPKVEQSVRKLMSEMVEHYKYSSDEVNQNKLMTSFIQQDSVHLEQNTGCVKTSNHTSLKKGDWKCEGCNSFNFAKNMMCWHCNERLSGRQLGAGEWECDSCSYLNFRRNVVCLRCNYRRPKASIC